MKFKLITFLMALSVIFSSCSDVNFEEDIAGNWEFTFIDLFPNGGDGIYNSNFSDEPGPGSGAFIVTLDGVENYYNLETLITSSGKFTMEFFLDNDNRGSAECQLNSDGTGEGSYSFDWINDQTGETRTLSGNIVAKK